MPAPARLALRAPACFALLWTAFTALGLALYAPALRGEFFSDDQHYVHANAYVQELSVENLLAIWSPTSVVAEIVENYAPVHLTLHALEWQVFGTEVFGYHVVNVVLHALAAALLVAVFARSGIAGAWALAAGTVFLVHPANVEPVAWIAQIKTPAAMVAMLGALLLHPRRPAAALLCFAIALLAKPTAAVALPVAAAWSLRGARAEPVDDSPADVADDDTAAATRVADTPGAARWAWLGGWALVFVLFAIAEFVAFFETAGSAPPFYAELDLRIRSICAIALRYLVMAFTGAGLSVFHETPGAKSWLDPWWLGSLAMMAAIAWRSRVAWCRGGPELGYWVWAVVSFAPISGLISLPFPMADRYLYFILPGLLGAGALMLREGVPARRLAAGSAPAITAAVLAIGFFGFRAHARAELWQSPARLLADAEANYPDGMAAWTQRASRSAAAGDIEAAVASLRAMRERGWNRLDHLLADPVYRPYRDHPGFAAIVEELAHEMVARREERQDPAQVELRVLGQAQFLLGDLDAAEDSLLRALEVPGPYTEQIRVDLEALRRQRRIEADTARRRARRSSAGEAGR